MLKKRTINDELPLVESVNNSNEELVNSEVDNAKSNIDSNEIKIKLVFVKFFAYFLTNILSLYF